MLTQFIYICSWILVVLNKFIVMIDEPIIRKKHNLYPKDFTPSQKIHNSRLHSKASDVDKQEFSFSGRQRNSAQVNRSTQLFDDSKDDKRSLQQLLTINPEDEPKIFHQQPQNELPLCNQHLLRRRPYLNPQILSKPKIEEKINYQIPENSDPECQSVTPGSIKHNKSKLIQKPLQKQTPVSIFANPREDSSKKMEKTHSSFQELLRNNQINIQPGNGQRKLAALGRGGRSEDNGFKLSKKSNSPFSKTLKQPSLLFKNSDSPQKANLFSYNYLFSDNKVSKLKEHINQFVSEKSRNKNLKMHEETQSDYPDNLQHTQKTMKLARTKKILSASRFFPELGNPQYDNFAHDPNNGDPQEEQMCYDESYSPRKFNVQRHHVISYKTSLNNLKQIFKSIQYSAIHNKKSQVEIKVPRTLMSLKINPNIDKQSLYMTSLELFKDLKIPPTNLSIKRYSNCVIMVAKSVSIIYHYSSKIYLGSWQTIYLDEGVRHGLGLEWVPNKYVYYGEYVNNKREGLGIYKESNTTYIGQFQHGHRTGGYIINSSGQVYEEAQQSNTEQPQMGWH